MRRIYGHEDTLEEGSGLVILLKLGVAAGDVTGSPVDEDINLAGDLLL